MVPSPADADAWQRTQDAFVAAHDALAARLAAAPDAHLASKIGEVRDPLAGFEVKLGAAARAS